MTDLTANSTRRDIKVIALIGIGHGISHFCQLVLAPLFPLLKNAFGVGYTELGLMVTLYYAMSGLAQTPSGFLVDRFGARKVLLGGLGLSAASLGLVGLAPGYWLALPLVVLAGLGNSVFHPADYAILSHTINHRRMARAYGIHTVSGNLGWAAAPPVMLALSALLGWRGALIAVGLAGLAIVLLFARQSRGLADHRQVRAGTRTTGAIPRRTAFLAILTSPAILLCFGYFALISIALTGTQNFMPSALNALYQIPLDTAGAALTFFLLGGALGILVGGILADRTARHDIIVACGLFIAAALVLTVGFVALPGLLLMAMTGGAGFASGITSPSRDMLARAATPPGSTGKVFGFIYSGLDLGSALAPAILGLLLDRGAPHMVFVLSAVALTLAITTAFGLRLSTGAPAPSARTTPAE